MSCDLGNGLRSRSFFQVQDYTIITWELSSRNVLTKNPPELCYGIHLANVRGGRLDGEMSATSLTKWRIVSGTSQMAPSR
jgi:hypothetical protein